MPCITWNSMFSGWVNKLKAWVSGEAGEYDWEEAHAKYLCFLTPGPFQRAVAGGDVELVREMLASGEDPNQLDELNGVPGGLNAIECAMAMLNHRRRPEDADAVRDLYACIELCLDAGALPDGPRTDGEHTFTPLYRAVELGRPEFVRLLLSAGADPWKLHATPRWRSATSIWPRSRRPAASRPTSRPTARDSWQLSRRSLRISFRRSSFRSSSTSRFM